jgi:hypothetical protein
LDAVGSDARADRRRSAEEAAVDPFLLAMAAELAARYLDEGVGAAWSSLIRLVRGKTMTDEGVRMALKTAHAEPSNAERVRHLAGELDRVAGEDSSFKDQLWELWVAAEPELRAAGVANSIIGSTVGKVLQARDIHGDVSFGSR